MSPPSLKKKEEEVVKRKKKQMKKQKHLWEYSICKLSTIHSFQVLLSILPKLDNFLSYEDKSENIKLDEEAGICNHTQNGHGR